MMPSKPAKRSAAPRGAIFSRPLVALALLFAGACASSAAQTPSASGQRDNGRARAAKGHEGGPMPGDSLERPMQVCGPRESYRYVAEGFQCPGGGNPLRGDLERAQHARLGALDHPQTGHIVDVYRVPCPDGDVQLFVDMYGCSEYEAQLTEDAPSSSLEQLMTHYDEEDYGAVISQCDRSPAELEADESMYCMVLVPASFFVTGKASVAVGVLRDLCDRLPPPSSLSDARANLVVQVTTAVARTAELRGNDLDSQEGGQIVGVFAAACQVTPEDLKRALHRAETL
jgi:hypothetical protein